MGMEYKSGYCRRCKTKRQVERKGANHIKHLILTILTAGIWLIFWFGESFKVDDWRCSQCGSLKVSKIS